MSGVIAKLPLEEGDEVKKGDLLFRLRTQDMSLRIRQAKAGLKAAEVRLAAVEVEYGRTKRLFEKNAIDQANWDRARAEFEGARAGIEAAEANVALAKKGLTDATVRSPIDGVVARKLKNVGEMVTMMPPTVVLVVEDHRTLELRFHLPERALKSLKVGDQVDAAFASVGLTRAAKVSRISPNVDRRTRTVEVVAEISNADSQLKAGMLADVRVGAGATK
jgi:RND family efflux transporter MFP subunit